jgi:hypothetical protein
MIRQVQCMHGSSNSKRMRREIITILLLLVGSTLLAQDPPAIEWQRNYGGSDHESGMFILPALDGGYIVASNSLSTDGDLICSTPIEFLWLKKIGPQGELEWQKCHGSQRAGDQRISMVAVEDGYVLVTSIGLLANDIDCEDAEGKARILKVDVNGEKLWEHCYGGSSNDFFGSIQRVQEGFLVVGNTTSQDGDITNPFGARDIWVLLLNNEGGLIWSRNYGGSNTDHGLFGRQSSDGGYWICGSTSSNDHQFIGLSPVPFQTKAFLMKLASNGDLLWAQTYGVSSANNIIFIVENDNEMLAIGRTGLGNDDAPCAHWYVNGWAVRIDLEGNLLDSRCFGGNENESFHSVLPLSGGRTILAGYTFSNDGDVSHNLGWMDAWLVMIESDLSIVWEKTYGGSNHENALCITATEDGAIFVGSSNSSDGDLTGNNGGLDVWVAKLGPWNVGMEEIPSRPTLLAYPNPAGNILNVDLKDLSRSGLDLEVLDLTSRRVLVHKLHASTGVFTLPVDHLGAGTYVVRVNDPSGAMHARFIKL